MKKLIEEEIRNKKSKFIKCIMLFTILLLCIIFNNKVQAAEKFGEFYTTKDEYITRILPETTLQDFKNNLENQNIQVTSENGKVLSNTEYIGTTTKLKNGNVTYMLSVIGDVDGNGEITVTDAAKINLHKNNLKILDDKYLLSADINNDGKISLTDVVQINLAVVSLKDLIAPVSFNPTITATQNSITIEGHTTDQISGIAEYSFKLDNGEWVQNVNKTNGKYIFSGINKNLPHTVLMKVKDNAGNEKKTIVKNINIPTGQISITPSTTAWTNEGVTITLASECSDSSIDKYISVDGGITFKKYTSPVQVTKNTKIVSKLEGEIYKEVAKSELLITNIDKLQPNDFTATVTTNRNTITISARTQDAEATTDYGKSGIKEYEYTIKNGNNELTQKSTQTTYTFSNLTQEGIYSVKVFAIDNAGNRTLDQASKTGNNQIDVAFKYVINYDANGGQVTPSRTAASYGERITMPTPTRTYTVTFNTNGGNSIATQNVSSIFRGWYTAKVGGERAEYTTMPEIQDGSLTVYAHWNTPSITLPTAVKSGSTFDGWYENQSFEGTGIKGGNSFVPTKNTIFYAKWK